MSNLPSDTPRLPKWPFLLADAFLLGTAALIATRNPAPYAPGMVAAIAICVVLGCILGAIPFLTDYAHRQDEALDERQRALEALARTIADSAEQISVAANSMHETTELARRQLNQFESMPDAVGEGLSDLNQQLSGSLGAAVETLQKEIKSLKPSGDSRKSDPHAERLQQLQARLEAAEAKLSAQIAALVKAAPPPVAPAAATVTPVETPPVAPIEPVTAPVPTPPAVPAPAVEAEPPKPAKKPAAPKKPKPDEGDELPLETPAPAVEAPVEKPTAAASTDSATRLLVTAYIGIGNRLFIRGDGPGLSQDKGQPLQFVSIGKWQWETKDASTPVRIRLFKNDEIECTALGEIELAPGHQLEVSASF